MNKRNPLSILSLIFAFIIPLLGGIFGIIALVQIKKTNQKGKGLAITGIILSIFFLFLSLAIGLSLTRKIFI